MVRVVLPQGGETTGATDPLVVEALPLLPALYLQARFHAADPLLEAVAPEGTLPHALANYDHLRHFLVAAPEVVFLTWWLDPLGLWQRRYPAWLEPVDAALPMAWAPGHPDADGAWRVAPGDLGGVVVRGWHPDFGPAWGFALLDGSSVPAPTLEFRARPWLTVQALAGDGDPLAHHPVHIAVWMDPEDYDRCALDRPLGFARVGVGPPGETSAVLWREVVTDANGRARLRVPRGRGYGLLVGDQGRFLFRTISASVSQPHDLALTADLGAAAPNEPVTLRFLDTSGKPLAGARVRLTVANDAPWVRQFPPLCTDAEGLVRVAGFRPGERIAAVVEHPGLTCPFTLEKETAWTETVTWTGRDLVFRPLARGDDS